ncbi:MAG: hypothetical protein KGM99_15010 [Burkholderiales bacterium]|nr:hypothetical protein [Burkholderiales bacterium]
MFVSFFLKRLGDRACINLVCPHQLNSPANARSSLALLIWRDIGWRISSGVSLASVVASENDPALFNANAIRRGSPRSVMGRNPMVSNVASVAEVLLSGRTQNYRGSQQARKNQQKIGEKKRSM